jgi:outer membrane autotransporter protein
MGFKIKRCMAVALVMATLQADEIHVTSIDDAGPGTLRAAIAAAQPTDFIVFDQSLSNQTILLSSDLPPINAKLNIVGPSGGNAVLHGNDRFRLLTVLGGSVAISRIDLSHPDTSTPGGALFADSNAAVSLSDLTISPPGNNSIFANTSAQIKAENISIWTSDPSTRASLDAPHTLLLFPGSTCTIYSDLDDMTCITATGSGYITTQGTGIIDLDTVGDSVDFTLHAREGTLRFRGNSTQPIIVAPGSTLRGNNGSLYIANRGLIKTGLSIGMSSIIGDLIQMGGSTLEAEIAPSGASDQYLVGGNANLAGDLFVLAERGVYFKGETFTFLTTGGVVNGTFDSTSTNSGGLAYKINYFPQGVQIEILKNLLSFDGDSFRGAAGKIYSILTDATVTPGSDLASVITRLSALDPPADLQQALGELTPASLGTLGWNEAAVLHHLNATVLQERDAFCGRNCLKKPIKPCCPASKKNGLWVSGLGVRLRQGFKATTYGGLIGYDRALSNNTTLGVAGGYTDGHLSWNHKGGKTSTQRYTGALYLAFCLGRLQVDLSGAGSYSNNHIKRAVPSLQRAARSDPHGRTMMGHLGARYLFVRNDFKITPFINGEYFYTHTNGLKEDGAQSINLRTRPFKTNFTRGEAGIAVGEEFCTSWGIFSPALALSYVRLSSSSNTRIKSKFATLPGSFTVHSAKHTFNEIAPAASLGFSAGNQVWLSATYEGEFAKKRQDQTISLNLRVQF